MQGQSESITKPLPTLRPYHSFEIDALRAEQEGKLDIRVIQANAMDVWCPAESLSLENAKVIAVISFLSNFKRASFSDDAGVQSRRFGRLQLNLKSEFAGN